LFPLGKLAWSEIPKMAPLSILFQKVFESYEASLSKITFPFLKCGRDSFTITNNSDILWRRRNVFVKILRGNENDTLTHLALDGRSLFSLNTDGKITQWNLTHCRVIRTIQSSQPARRSFCSDSVHRDKRTKSALCGPNSFLVQDRHIVLFHHGNCIEIIPYLKPDERHVVTPAIADPKILLMIIQSKLYLGTKTSLHTYDFKKRSWDKPLRLETDPPLDIHDMSIQEGIILTCDGVATLTLYSETNGKLIRRRHFNVSNSFCNPSVKWTHHIMLKNLFLGYGLVERAVKVITIIDLNTWKIVRRIENLFDFHTQTLNPEPLAQLVSCCRNHISELRLDP